MLDFYLFIYIYYIIFKKLNSDKKHFSLLQFANIQQKLGCKFGIRAGDVVGVGKTLKQEPLDSKYPQMKDGILQVVAFSESVRIIDFRINY